MNKQKKGFIHIGFSSILMVFTMLCLVTFATLSLITANSDYRLSLKVAEKTTRLLRSRYCCKELSAAIRSGTRRPLRKL